TPKQTSKHTARLFFRSAKAENVFVAGSFNGWKDVKLQKNGTRWETSIDLAPGRYEYHFIADGEVLDDPLAPIKGTKGSILIIK
ncbi:MAG: glycogen-binding domain-containing protein, partial [Elusimicrobiaceae bacterium]